MCRRPVNKANNVNGPTTLTLSSSLLLLLEFRVLVDTDAGGKRWLLPYYVKRDYTVVVLLDYRNYAKKYTNGIAAVLGRPGVEQQCYLPENG